MTKKRSQTSHVALPGWGKSIMIKAKGYIFGVTVAFLSFYFVAIALPEIENLITPGEVRGDNFHSSHAGPAAPSHLILVYFS